MKITERYQRVDWHDEEADLPYLGLGKPRKAVGVTAALDLIDCNRSLREHQVRMAHAGELPAFRIRGQRRVERTEFEQWIDAQLGGGDGGRDGE